MTVPDKITSIPWAALAAVLGIMMPGVVRAETISLPSIIGGQVASRQAGPRPLTLADTAGVKAWLEQHRSGWQPNLATSPVAEFTLILQADGPAPVMVLSLWPNAREPDWRRSVLIEYPGTKSSYIRIIPDQDETVLLGFAR
ncbi:MAG: hypothetical protein ACRYG8_24860 [Janthinobacterium lividum]